MVEKSVLDIRTYRTVPGGREEFLRIMADEAVPMLHRYGIEVVAFGPAVQDDDHAILIRFFASLEERKRQLERFYGSEEWLTHHDPRVVPLIETYHTVVLPASPEVAAALSALGRIGEGGAPPMRVDLGPTAIEARSAPSSSRSPSATSGATRHADDGGGCRCSFS